MKCVRFNLSTIDKNTARVQHEHLCTFCIVEPHCKSGGAGVIEGGTSVKCVRFNLSTIDQTRCHSICHRTPICSTARMNPWKKSLNLNHNYMNYNYRTIKHIQYLIQIGLNNDTANMTFCCSQCKIGWIFAWLFMCDIFISKIGEN